MLLQTGADLNARPSSDMAPLMWATKYNENPEVIKVLLEAGADPNARENNRWTPLMLAAEQRESRSD